MNQQEFISMENPWEYNFEFECDELCGLETYERYFSYKATGLEPGGKCYPEAEAFIEKCREKYKVSDCDNCKSLSQFYTALWGNKDWRGDTMNSVQKCLAELTANFGSNEKAELKGNADSRRYLTQCFCGENHENFIRKLDKNEWLRKYIDAYHTLGNFVLVPNRFNPYRASAFKDFWDLSLNHLKNEGHGDLKPESFNKYINYFFLWDYVKVENNEYKVKPVGMDKLSDNRNIPEFFQNSVKLIERRGKFMTAMLMIQDSDSETYKTIQTEFFAKDDVLFDGIDEAAKKVIDDYGDKIPNNAKELLEKI